jgi:hypothetical protein
MITLRTPNYFIIGAPKCGTTAMAEYLRGHPNVFMSWPKEPHYFAEDFDRYRRIKTLDAYLDIFRPAKATHAAIGEASVWYLYSSVAVQRIREFNEHSKIIVMLRNPVDLVYSLHNTNIYAFFEDEPDFGRAWALQSQRKEGKFIPKACLEPALLQYKQIGQLGEQLKRVLRVFPSSQVKVILFEDFTRSPRAAYEEVLAFLGVPSDGRTEFPKINPRQQHRARWLGRLLINPPEPLRQLERYTKNLLARLGVRNFKAWHLLIHGNVRVVRPKPLDEAIRRELAGVFRSDVQKLSKMLGRELTHWCE